jgi:aldehyde dehydrogenase (NAD+)
MQNADHFYIEGEWVQPATSTRAELIDPSTEKAIGTVALGGAKDVDRAVGAARAAFVSFSQTSVENRISLLERIIEVYQTRADDIATTLMVEMGAPAALATHCPGRRRAGPVRLGAGCSEELLLRGGSRHDPGPL